MYKSLVFTTLLGASAMIHTVAGADLKTKSARAIDGGVNYLLYRAMLPKVVPARTARGGVIKVPSANYQTAHTALTVLGLMSAGYETCDNTAEGFAMREETSFLLSSGQQGADGYWGGTDRSMMFGHGLSLLAISELLQSGNVVDNRTEASIRASFAGKMSIRSQRGGAWSGVPPVGGGGALGTVVSAIQVLGLKSLASLGGRIREFRFISPTGCLSSVFCEEVITLTGRLTLGNRFRWLPGSHVYSNLCWHSTASMKLPLVRSLRWRWVRLDG